MRLSSAAGVVGGVVAVVLLGSGVASAAYDGEVFPSRSACSRAAEEVRAQGDIATCDQTAGSGGRSYTLTVTSRHESLLATFLSSLSG